MKLHYPWILIALLLMAACSKSSDDDAAGDEAASNSGEVEPVAEADEEEEDYRFAPLKIGTQEQYILRVAQSGLPPKSYVVTYHTTGTQEIKGKTYFKTEIDMGGCPGIPDHVEYEREVEDGRYVVAERDGELSEEFMIFPQPLPQEIGSEWEVSPPFETSGKFWIAGYEDQTLLGITHENCLKISFTREHCEGHIWHKRGVGAVKCVFDYGSAVLVYLLKVDDESEPES